MSFQQRVPASESVTQVEFAISDADYPFVAVSALDGYRTMLEEFIPRSAGEYAEFFSVAGGSPDPFLELAGERDGIDFTLLEDHEEGGLVELSVSDNCPAVFLGEQGALPRTVYSEGGEGRIEAEIYASEDPGRVVDAFLDAHPTARLVAKREQPYVRPMFSQCGFERVLENRLTDRQKEVLATAHEAGYYQWPRETTGEEVARDLDVSAPTMHKHLRAAERKLISVFFEKQSPLS